MDSITPAKYTKLYVAISGIIGAGKTTLAQALGTALDCPVYCEAVHENPYLAKFYNDQERYAFQLQVHLLNQRFAQQQQIAWSKRPAVQDRSIYEDRVFAKMLTTADKMSPLDYNTYIELSENMMHFMKKPTLIVHLDVTPERSLERIRARARACEDGITIEYLRALHAGYEEFIAEISREIPVIRIDWNEFHSATAVASAIKEKCETMQNINVIKFS